MKIFKRILLFLLVLTGIAVALVFIYLDKQELRIGFRG